MLQSNSQRIALFWTCLFAAVLCTKTAVAQKSWVTSAPHRGVVHVPISYDVYDFVRHLYARGLIKDYSATQLPLSEYELSQVLLSVDVSKLSGAEFGLRERYLNSLNLVEHPVAALFPREGQQALLGPAFFSEAEKYLFYWKDDSTLSDLSVRGIGSIEVRQRSEFEPGHVVLGNIGGNASGTIGGHVGYFLQATNGQDFGDSSVAHEDPLLRTNKNFSVFSKNNFDFTSAELSYNYDWFTARLAREALSIGGSISGDNIILSPNVPFYDFVSLGAKVGIVRYKAVVASLLGESRFSVGADTQIYYGSGAYIDPKYLTLHDLSVLFGDFEFGFTDLVIYSRRFDLAYVNPFSFLKSVEHSLNDRDNGLLAFHTKYRFPGLEINGAVLLDDVIASQIGKGFWGNKFAWQLGALWAQPLGIVNVDAYAEWTRVEPYTYSHFLGQNTYASSGTVLGSQNGPNTIHYLLGGRWFVTERLFLRAEASLLEKGENIYDSTGALIFNAGADFEQTIRNEQDKYRSTHILDGQRLNLYTLNLFVEYEPWKNLRFFAHGTKKVADYLKGTPFRPVEHSEFLLSIGIKAFL